METAKFKEINQFSPNDTKLTSFHLMTPNYRKYIYFSFF